MLLFTCSSNDIQIELQLKYTLCTSTRSLTRTVTIGRYCLVMLSLLLIEGSETPRYLNDKIRYFIETFDDIYRYTKLQNIIFRYSVVKSS